MQTVVLTSSSCLTESVFFSISTHSKQFQIVVSTLYVKLIFFFFTYSGHRLQTTFPSWPNSIRSCGACLCAQSTAKGKKSRFMVDEPVSAALNFITQSPSVERVLFGIRLNSRQ